jgi:hypothetical protein
MYSEVAAIAEQQAKLGGELHARRKSPHKESLFVRAASQLLIFNLEFSFNRLRFVKREAPLVAIRQVSHVRS